MALDADLLQKPFLKLRKALKRFPKLPSPDEVHRLRTQTRRLEATLHALMLDQKRDGSRLLEALAPVRKAAGKVRDMDVLVGFASSLTTNFEDECLVQLLEHLGNRRVKAAAELHRIIAGQKNEARHRLTQYSEFIEGEIETARPGISNTSQTSADAMAVSLQLEMELAAWPKLNAGNIHPFRLKVKELRYILQLARDSDLDFIETLGEVKDRIGEWHDWSELALIADDIIDRGPASKLNKWIRGRVKDEFKKALAIANRMRRQYLGDAIGRRREERRPPIRLKDSVVRATLRLAG